MPIVTPTSPSQPPSPGGSGSGAGRWAWASLPNLLSLSRLPLALVAGVAVLGDAALLAMMAFWLAVATDLADGRIARARGQVSALGGLFDHGSDALFVTALLAVWSVMGEIPVCLPILVPLAFTQYMLDSRALAGQRLRASTLGRWNGVAYFVLAGVPTVRDGLGLPLPDAQVVRMLGWCLIATTLVSMVERAWVFVRLQRG